MKSKIRIVRFTNNSKQQLKKANLKLKIGYEIE